MYFPYLYDKANELHALDEITPIISQNSNVTPIINPLNANSATINKLNSLSESKIPYIIIINPQKGNLKDDIKKLKDLLAQLNLEHISLGYYITSETTVEELNKLFNDYSNNNFSFLHLSSPTVNTDDILQIMYQNQNKIDHQIFFQGQTSELYIRNFDEFRKVLIQDGFDKASRNADYPNYTYFSDLYKTYASNYYGFGDYQIVGKELVESGGPAHAVAIHLTTVSPREELLVQHFLSDDIKGAQNPAGKYLQAVKKLVNFVNTNEVESTLGIENFKNTLDRSHYPGLGMAKRYSIEHHIELISNKI